MTLYSSLSPPALQKEWLVMPVRAVVEATCRGPRSGPTIPLQATVFDEELEEDVAVPTVLYHLEQ